MQHLRQTPQNGSSAKGPRPKRHYQQERKIENSFQTTVITYAD